MTDPIASIALIVGVAAIPFLALAATSYTKIVVVLGLLRNALGVQQVPPNMVINSLAIILSVYIMAPVFYKFTDTSNMNSQGSSKSITLDDIRRGYENVSTPLKGFLDKHADEREKRFFVRSAEALWPPEMVATISEKDMLVLIPAFTVTELTKAFQIGFVLYMSFIIIDLVVANVLLALGMQMLSPTNISVPFKLLLFVVLDGWSLLLHNIVLGYR